MSTFIIGTVLAIIVVAIIVKLYKDKKRGVSCGCGGCDGCSKSGGCASAVKTEEH